MKKQMPVSEQRLEQLCEGDIPSYGKCIGLWLILFGVVKKRKGPAALVKRKFREPNVKKRPVVAAIVPNFAMDDYDGLTSEEE